MKSNLKVKDERINRFIFDFYLHYYEEEEKMKKALCFITALALVFMGLIPISAEPINPPAEDKTNEIVYLYNNESNERVIGTLYYAYVVTITYLAINGQVIVEQLDFLSNFYDCLDQIDSYVQQYVVVEKGGTYQNHTAQYTGTVYDDGCWSPEFPNNPFCRIRRE